MKALTATVLGASLFLGLAVTPGCTKSHTETDKTTITGARKHEETTVTKNPVTGDTSVQHTESKSR